MNPERDKYLTEVVLGECWDDPRFKCSKCNLLVAIPIHNNFSLWEDFGKLWNAMKEKKEWGEEFIEISESGHVCVLESLINPDSFADAVYEFWKKKL